MDVLVKNNKKHSIGWESSSEELGEYGFIEKWKYSIIDQSS